MEVSEPINIGETFHVVEGDSQMVFYGEPSPCNLEETPSTELLIEKAESEASLRMHLHIIKLSKQFGVDFEGCEEDVLSLLMKIDSRRQKKMRECSAGITPEFKSKGQKQLKGLISGI